MPNWSQTKIEVQGSHEEIQEISSVFAKQGLSSFGLEEPTDDMYYENWVDKDGLNHTGNWYSWRISNWGTKWNIDTNNVRNETSPLSELLWKVTLEFSSADSGPDKWFRHIMSTKSLSGSYSDFESGDDFSVVIEYKNGEESCYCFDEYISDNFINIFGAKSLKEEYEYVFDEGLSDDELKEEYGDTIDKIVSLTKTSYEDWIKEYKGNTNEKKI